MVTSHPTSPDTSEDSNEYVETDITAVQLVPFYVPVEYNPTTDDLRFRTDEKTEATSDPGFTAETESFLTDTGERLDDEDDVRDYIRSGNITEDDVREAILKDMAQLVSDDRYLIAYIIRSDKGSVNNSTPPNMTDEEYYQEVIHSSETYARETLKLLMDEFDKVDVQDATRESYPEAAEWVDSIRSSLN